MRRQASAVVATKRGKKKKNTTESAGEEGMWTSERHPLAESVRGRQSKPRRNAQKNSTKAELG